MQADSAEFFLVFSGGNFYTVSNKLWNDFDRWRLRKSLPFTKQLLDEWAAGKLHKYIKKVNIYNLDFEGDLDFEP